MLGSIDRRTMQQEALVRAKYGKNNANCYAIIHEFASRGIPENEIHPRENVFTFHAWKALGRSVRKGEHGVKVTTYIPCEKVKADGTIETFSRCKMATVFHVSQTELSKE